MNNSKSQLFIEELKARGFFYQCTDEQSLIQCLHSRKGASAYIGFDCTATSLHVGNLIQIMLLRLLQKHGIKPIILIGGGTTKIGDPTFKDKARVMLDDAQIITNSTGIKQSLAKFIKFGDEPEDALMVNNDDWLSKLSYTNFLRDHGKHFSVNKMLTLDSIKMRLEREQNLSFLEFNYMILQAYDFLYLYDNYNCILQCGGSDQWGNIINGVELIRRTHGKEAFGLTTPLATTSSGSKMGKTAQGAVWLNKDMLSAFEYYQYWRNIDDADVFKFMKLFTDLPLDDIQTFETSQVENINEYKKILAIEATKICHGKDEAIRAHEASISAFEKGNMHDINSIPIAKSTIEQTILLCELLKISGLCSSNGEGRRLIKGGGAKLNQTKILDENFRVTNEHIENGCLILSSGKKRHIKLTVS